MTPATAAQAFTSSPHDTTLFPSPASLHARGLTGLLVRAGLAVAAWGERRAVSRADAAVNRLGARLRRPVRDWSDPSPEDDRYAAHRAAGHLTP